MPVVTGRRRDSSARAVDGAVTAQDKYALQVPDGLAFSEFKGYETWQVVSVSHSDETLNVIVATRS